MAENTPDHIDLHEDPKKQETTLPRLNAEDLSQKEVIEFPEASEMRKELSGLVTDSKLLKKPKQVQEKTNNTKALSKPGNVKRTGQKLTGIYLQKTPQNYNKGDLLKKFAKKFAPKKQI